MVWNFMANDTTLTMQKTSLPYSQSNNKNGNVVKRTRRRKPLTKHMSATLTAGLFVVLLVGSITADEQPERQTGVPSKEVADTQHFANKRMVSYAMMDGALSPLDTYGYMSFIPQASGGVAQQHQPLQHYGGGGASPQLMMLPADISEIFRPMKRVPYEVSIDEVNDEMDKRSLAFVRFGRRDDNSENVVQKRHLTKKEMPGVLRFGKRDVPGVLRFGKRSPMDIPNGVLRFGKRDDIPGVLRFGKRGGEFADVPGVLRFGKRSGDADMMMPAGVLRFGKKSSSAAAASADDMPGVLRFGRRRR